MTLRLRAAIVPDHERLNSRLTALLLDMADRIPDAESYAPGAPSYFDHKWRSTNDLFRSPDPAVAELVAVVEQHANRSPWLEDSNGQQLSVYSMWAIVARNGMSGRAHIHRGAVSGAYYVNAGDCGGDNGAFVAYTLGGKVGEVVPPQPGLLLLFTSAMPHGVNLYQGARPRIVISFNLATNVPS